MNKLIQGFAKREYVEINLQFCEVTAWKKMTGLQNVNMNKLTGLPNENVK
jgi:hypothetical protein